MSHDPPIAVQHICNYTYVCMYKMSQIAIVFVQTTTGKLTSSSIFARVVNHATVK